jgi:membrane protein required for colicin V production
LNAVDIAVVVVLLASGVFALMRGFVYETLAMAGWIAAGLAAFWGLPIARPIVSKYISNPTIADVAGGVAIFLVVLLVSSVITTAISRSVQKSAISSVDRSLGFAFGLIRGLVLCSLCFILATKLFDPEPDVLTGAKTRPLLVMGSRVLQALVPSQLSSAQDAAKEAAEAAIQAQQAKEMYDRLNAPRPKGADQPGQNTGNNSAQPSSPSKSDNGQGGDKTAPSYDNRGLERLIETTK